jgi:TolB-like protein
MKRICITSVLSLMLLLSIGMVTTGFAQSKTDAVIMLNGERKEGKVLGMGANTVKFKYTGEDLEYELPKGEISKIQFASGRVEVINEAPQTAASGSSPPSRSPSNPADRKNKIAVLPFQFVSNEAGLQSDQMSRQLQANCASSLQKNTSNIIVQDPLTTNRLLAKNNIDMNDAATVDPQEMAVVLGVEYVVFGSVDVINKGTISTGGASTTYKDKEKQTRDKNSKDTKASGTATTSNSAITTTNYDTRVALNIYTDQGSTYYAKSRNAIGNSMDSYTGTLDYLIKRTPFGTKSR